MEWLNSRRLSGEFIGDDGVRAAQIPWLPLSVRAIRILGLSLWCRFDLFAIFTYSTLTVQYQFIGGRACAAAPFVEGQLRF
jgi:hypothetical protein